mgnify:CR=1 FL=1
MFKQKFATNLKNIRKSRRLTQEQLAEAVGVDFRYISYIENAKSFPSCDLIERLAGALNTDYSELFCFDNEVSREELENNVINIIRILEDKKLKILYKFAKGILE